MNIAIQLAIMASVALAIMGCQADDQIRPIVARDKVAISGHITGLRNAPISGIVVNAGAYHGISNNEGYYSISNVPNGDYEISPKLPGFTFTPTKRPAHIAGQDIEKLDFTIDYPQDMRIIIGGSFQMGSNNGNSDERPVHDVSVRTFAISRYEVTQIEWLTVMGNNPSHFKGDSLPVEQVSWFDAVSFCNALSVRDGLEPVYVIDSNNTVCNFNATGYRLPTEAEWEFACRCGTATDFYAGDQTIHTTGTYIDPILDEIGWYYGNSNNTTHIVGQKRPNNFGLFDITGNVFEWCWDWRSGYSNNTQADPVGPSTGTLRICRGGSWYYVPYESRSMFRLAYVPKAKYSGVGFRIVRTIM